MLNQCALMGRLTRDPEQRNTGNGTPVTTFTLAVERDFGTQPDGSKAVDFIDIIAWRNTAEFVSKYFSKGRMAVVSGSLQIKNWTDKDGNKRRSPEIVADRVYFGDSKQDSPRAPAPPDSPTMPRPATGPVTVIPDDGELPFLT